MKAIARKPVQTVVIPATRNFITLENSRKLAPVSIELRGLRHVQHVVFLITVLFAIFCFSLSIHNAWAVPLVSSGLLCVLSAIAVLVARYQIERSKNWLEICIMALCSIYAPFLALWIASGNLLGALAYRI